MLAELHIVLASFDLKIFDLNDIAKILAENTRNSDLLLLSGKVGSGKTELARRFLKAKAIKEKAYIEEVSSPSFPLVQSYQFSDCKISHIDLYRVNSELELFELGIPDIFDSQITLLEWPEILETKSLSRYINIKIQETKNIKNSRDVKIEFFGNNWNDLSQALLESRHFSIEKI